MNKKLVLMKDWKKGREDRFKELFKGYFDLSDKMMEFREK